MKEEIEFNGYRIERVTPAHYKDLVYISKSAFGLSPSINYYQRKNATEKFGETNLGFIAYHIESNEPAAFYGVYSYPVVLNTQTIMAAQSGDTMTHKNHTGKGLFIELAKRTYELARNSGIGFIFGFPNEHSYPGFVKKLNWRHDGNLQLFQFTVHTIPLLKAAKKFKFFRPFYKVWLSFILLFYRVNNSAFASSNETGEQFCVSHSIDFIKYKSFSGSMIIRIAKTKIWIKPDGFLYIGDLEKNVNDYIEYFLAKLKRFAFLIGADKIIFGASKNSYWYSKFSAITTSKEGAYFGYCLLGSALPMEKFTYVLADLDTF